MSQHPKTDIPLAIVLKGYPRLSETFIAQEIRALEKAGFKVTLYSLRHPTDKATHPIHDEIEANVVYLPEYLYQEPLRVLRSLWKMRNHVVTSGVLKTWWCDFKRDRTANRIRRLGQAFVFAAELPTHIEKVYVHFLHTPASVTRYACQIRTLPWACSAHAKDIWTSPEWEIREKLDSLKWLTTCTHANTEFLSGLSSDSDKVSLNYHGLDLSRFSCEAPNFSNRDGTDPNDPVQLLSVGRAVPKKGYPDLLTAFSNIPKDQHWHFTHIGGGPELKKLRSMAQSLSIDNNITWLGPQPQQVVLEHYQQSDLFVLNSQIDDSGDRDGLPNVLVEAQSQGLPVISTPISGIPELIEHEKNGHLTDAIEPLTQTLTDLISSPETRKQLGIAGHHIVHTRFDMNKNHEDLHTLLKAL